MVSKTPRSNLVDENDDEHDGDCEKENNNASDDDQ